MLVLPFETNLLIKVLPRRNCNDIEKIFESQLNNVQCTNLVNCQLFCFYKIVLYSVLFEKNCSSMDKQTIEIELVEFFCFLITIFEPKIFLSDISHI